MKPLPPVAEILAQYTYDPDTGIFRHAYPKRGRRRADGTAGFRGPTRYIYLRVTGQVFLAHRLAWKIIYGIDPEGEVDHKDTVRTNNAKNNLRLADEAQQSWNSNKPKSNTSGYKGISWDNRKKFWQVRIQVRGTIYSLKTHKTAAEAHAAYAAAAYLYHGEFANPGAIE